MSLLLPSSTPSKARISTMSNPEVRKSFYFLPKVPGQASANAGDAVTETENTPLAPQEESGSWFFGLFGRKGYSAIGAKLRKVPTKVEPKVFFANERTFLAWMHMSITLSSISVAILAFADANEWSQVYGLMLMPVAIAFCCYSLWMYMKRATMIRARHPGPYEDKVGPVVLAVLLGSTILANFAINALGRTNGL